jgi:hypothetical protein
MFSALQLSITGSSLPTINKYDAINAKRIRCSSSTKLVLISPTNKFLLLIVTSIHRPKISRAMTSFMISDEPA